MERGMMAGSPLQKKLRIQPGQSALFFIAPSGFTDSLGKLPEGFTIRKAAGGKHDYVHIFVNDGSDLRTLLPKSMQAVVFDGLLWVSYPKQSSGVGTDLNRDSIWEFSKGTSIRPVSQVSLDYTWSAIRLLPDQQVGK